MKQKEEDDRWIVPKIVWKDAEARLRLLEEMRPSTVRIRRSSPIVPISPIMPVRASALILGPDGKPLA